MRTGLPAASLCTPTSQTSGSSWSTPRSASTGRSETDSRPPEQTLGSIRRAEDEAAWRAVGRVPDRHEWLESPGRRRRRCSLRRAGRGGCADPRGGGSRRRRDVRPRRHLRASGSHRDRCSHRRGVRSTALERRVLGSSGWRTARSRSRCSNGGTASGLSLGLYTFDPTQTYHMRGVPDEQIRITVDCRGVTSRIVAGLREHKSQLHVMSDDPTNTEQWERRVRREWYAIAWPEPRARCTDAD